MSYKVGQVLYLLLHKESRVFPVQVVEVVLRRTLDGDQTNYSVKMPTKEGNVVDLEKIKAEIFLTPDDLSVFMNENAQKSIASIVEQSKKLASNMFQPLAEEQMPEEEVINTQVSEWDAAPAVDQVVQSSDTTATVDLGDGLTARINLDSIGG